MWVIVVVTVSLIACLLFLSCAVSLAARELSYKLVVVGGGAGGCGTANKFANKLGKDQVISDTAVIAVFMVTILLLLFCYCCCFKALPIIVAKIR